ncbi:MAG: hypothetical protein KBD01_00755 [Acidobacteria bacterium]|nr:hypothetical protein [Acidobacteriota bacterium]
MSIVRATGRGLAAAVLALLCWIPAPAAAPRLVHTDKPERAGVIDPAALAAAPAADESASRREIPNVLVAPPGMEGAPGAGRIFPPPAGEFTVVTGGDSLPPGATLASPAIDLRFDGPYNAGIYPPDPIMAVGKTNLVALINLRIAMYGKSGALLQGPFNLRDFFNIPAGWSDFDPLAIYDPHSDRFIVGVLTDNGSAKDSRIYLAFSQTNDATGAWNRYYIDADAGQPNFWADYGSIGIDRNAVYITANMFGRSSGSNVTLFIYDKEDGYAGRPLDHAHLIDVRTEFNGSPFVLRPATVTEVVPGDTYFLANVNSAFGDSLNLFRLTGDRFTSPVLTPSTVALSGLYFAPGNARQPGGNPGVDTLGARLWNVFYRNGRLWTAHSVSGSTSVAAWIHRIDVSAAPAVREQTYLVEVAGRDTYLPYVLPDVEDNDFALLSSWSGTDQYVTGRYWNISSAGVTRAAELLATPTRRNESKRYGDYSTIAADPSDGNRLWMIAQYQKNDFWSGNNGIASVLFEDVAAPSAPPPVPDGKHVPGQQLRVARAAGPQVTVTWDALSCPAPGNHLVWYDLGAISSYGIAATNCAVGASGSWTGAPPAGNVGVLVVSDDAGQTEGSYGRTSAGVERPSSTAACGQSTKRTDGTCN